MDFTMILTSMAMVCRSLASIAGASGKWRQGDELNWAACKKNAMTRMNTLRRGKRLGYKLCIPATLNLRNGFGDGIFLHLRRRHFDVSQHERHRQSFCKGLAASPDQISCVSGRISGLYMVHIPEHDMMQGENFTGFAGPDILYYGQLQWRQSVKRRHDYHCGLHWAEQFVGRIR